MWEKSGYQPLTASNGNLVVKSGGDWLVNGISGGIVYPQAAQPHGASETAPSSPDNPANLTARSAAFGRRCCLNSTVGIVAGYFLTVVGGAGGGLLYSRSIGLETNDVETKTNVIYGVLTGLLVYAAGVCCVGACKRVIGARFVEAVQGRENLSADANDETSSAVNCPKE